MTDDMALKHPLATLPGISYVTLLLLLSGSLCPKCQYGTRVTSKRWAKCKRCGERIPRKTMDDAAKEIREAEERALSRASPYIEVPDPEDGNG